jgi:hypothetical protein
MLRLSTLLGALLVCAAAQAQVMQVFVWDPLPGVANSTPQTIQNAMQAKAIQEKHGAQISVAQDQLGRIHFAVSHASYAAMNKFYNSLQQDEAQAAFWKAANANPVADQVSNYMLDVVAAGTGGTVFEVFIWQPLPGKTGAMFEDGMGAKPIHEKAGASVTILRDRLNRMHYLVQFDSWEAHAKFSDTPNPEFAEYMQKVSADPSAELVKTYRGSELQR